MYDDPNDNKSYLLGLKTYYRDKWKAGKVARFAVEFSIEISKDWHGNFMAKCANFSSLSFNKELQNVKSQKYSGKFDRYVIYEAKKEEDNSIIGKYYKIPKLVDIPKFIEDAHKSVKGHLTGRATADYITNQLHFY